MNLGEAEGGVRSSQGWSCSLAGAGRQQVAEGASCSISKAQLPRSMRVGVGGGGGSACRQGAGKNPSLELIRYRVLGVSLRHLI